MPELPEVETVCRGLVPVLARKTIQKAFVYTPKIRVPVPKGLAGIVEGRRVVSISRRAKYILIHLHDETVLIIHLGMTGTIRFFDNHVTYKKIKHDHLLLGLDNGKAMVFNDPRRFGMILHVKKSELETHASFRHLGPEPLEKEFTPKALQEALRGRKTAIKIALMDQTIVVGVGNIYASEALFRAGISPLRPAGDVSLPELKKLHAAIRAVLEEAIQSGGSTLRDYRKTDGELGYFQHKFRVYEHEGEACKGCKCSINRTGGIKKIVQGGRSTYYCPRKQH